ncbi:ABC transporter substrate-binding protein [Streptomyces fulvorobeus]|uniref:Multiple sugar transport system substrate-binding protein n=1 Tax=Streptomyces fulvorobeus TaxID=284028 RepID=A0A7J0C1R2_9ACTN|nr:extracellular solute-binding protein [Streptomyces fulvorobeus]NYE39631.1 multiple sugar transport system substrate-binding protein [Streptomyces fulvorobeus]GFM95873.1 sugar ABC transporter substrate-binding protein [Streptomyces fulvorobeus]
MQSTSRTSAPALAAAVAALALLATACGGADSGSADAATGSAGKPVDITYWSWMPGTKDMAAAFNKTHPDIKVTFAEIPAGLNGGYDKISKAVKAGNAPDVVNLEYQAVPDLVTQGLLRDSSGELAESVKGYAPASVQALVTLGGKTWAAPYDVGPQTLYYRTDLFKRYGIEVPTTWTEFRTAAEKVRTASRGQARLLDFWGDDTATWAGLSQQAGAQWYGSTGDAWKVSITDPATKKVADYWKDLVRNDLVLNHKAWSPEATKTVTDSRAIALIGASWSAGSIKTTYPAQAGKWAEAPLPHWGTPATGAVGGSAFAITKDSKKAKAAAEFIRWATTDEAAVKARLAAGTSSGLPAAEKLRAAAKSTFDASYFGGQDIYAVAGAQVPNIAEGWSWSPVHNSTTMTLQAEFGKAQKTGEFWAAFQAGQAAAEKAITDRGLKLAK